MGKIKVVALKSNQKKLSKIIRRFYNIATSEDIEKIRSDIFLPKKSLAERRRTFKKYKNVISALKPVFKKLAIERNRVARKEGYRNYFEFALAHDGIPKEKLELFFTSADKIIKKLNKRLYIPPNLPSWYWSEYNIPLPLDLVESSYYSIPRDIYCLMAAKYPRLKQAVPKINIVEKKEFYSQARYEKEGGVVTIEVSTKPSIYNTLSFVHELGHAITFFDLVNKGVDPKSKSAYWHEKEAIKVYFEFEELALSERVKNASRARALKDILFTFFEYAIYSNPNQDFDKVYADALNRVFLKARQTKNPFYVLENSLALQPCTITATSVVKAELLLKHHGNS